MRRELLSEGNRCIDVLVDGSGPAIVLLPSSQRDSLDFDPLAHGLAAAGYTVVRPQPRGMARSRGPMAGLSLHTLADDVAFAIKRLAVGPAVVAGHAYGHYVARVTALNHPEQVCGVALLAAAARTSSSALTEALDLAADATQPTPLRLAALQTAFFAPGNDPHCWLEGWHPHLRDVYRTAAASPPKAVWWPVSQVPVLDLQAQHDPWRPPATRGELLEAVGDLVTVHMIEGASHALIPEQPAHVAEAINGWIRGLQLHS